MPPKRSSVAGGKKKDPMGRKSRSAASGERTVKRLRLSKALTIPDATTVADACRRMAARRVDAALLTDSNALLCGIITDKDIATRVIAEGMSPDDTPVSLVMTKNPIFCMTETLAVDALQKMVQGKFRHLPVVENSGAGMEVVALLDITKCLYDAIARLERAAEKGTAIMAAVEGVERQWGSSVSTPNLMESLRDRMLRPTVNSIIDPTKLAVLSPEDSVYEAAKKMKELRISSVVAVIDDKPVGVLTTKDILMRVVALGHPAESTPIEKVMTANPECANVDITIVDALHTMHDGKFLHLPIIDRGGALVACVDVLQLTHGAFATMGMEEGPLLQKFWDSAMALDRDDDTDSYHGSDLSGRIQSESHMSERERFISTASMGHTFAYKIEDGKGRIHRFNAGTESLTELIVGVAARIGEDLNHQGGVPQLMYEDDVGDLVVLSSDADLRAAVSNARQSSAKVLKLHLDTHAKKKQEHSGNRNLPSGPGPAAQDMAWSPATSWMFAAAGIAAVGVGVMVYTRLSQTN